MSELVTVKNIGTLLTPIRVRLAELERPAQDFGLLITRLDTVERLAVHHIAQLEQHVPALMRRIEEAHAQGRTLCARLEAAVAEIDALHEREHERARILDRNLMGRLRWLLFGR